MLKNLEWLLRTTLDVILKHPVLFWSCFAANMVGAVFGTIFWYGPMLLQSPAWAFPFIPDCPLAALLGAVALLALRAGRHWPFFYALAAFACIKYGIWTITYWPYAWLASGQVYAIEIVLFITHIGLTIEGLLFVPRIGRFSIGGRVAVIGVFVASLVVDYVLGYHPPLGPVPVSFAAGVAVLLTTLLAVGLLKLPHARSQPRVTHSSTVGLAE